MRDVLLLQGRERAASGEGGSRQLKQMYLESLLFELKCGEG